ncbi:MAG: hypothetical protein PVF66_08620 [Candidatus Aminicenantes bacterium]|jgi:hypothetical protein
MIKNPFSECEVLRISIGLGIVVLLCGLFSCGNSGEISEDEPLPNAEMADALEMEGEEIFYDDGTIDGQHSPWVDETGGQLAVVFTPPYYPAILTKVRYFVSFGGFPTTKFRVRVYEATVADGPDDGKDLLTSGLTTAANSGFRWVEVDLSDQNILITSGDFCVSMEWLTAPGAEGKNAQFIGVDYTEPGNRRSWWKTSSSHGWTRIESVGDIGDRDIMIRAVIVKKESDQADERP